MQLSVKTINVCKMYDRSDSYTVFPILVQLLKI